MKTSDQKTSFIKRIGGVDSKNTQYGGTILGFILGLGTGLGIAFVIAFIFPKILLKKDRAFVPQSSINYQAFPCSS